MSTQRLYVPASTGTAIVEPLAVFVEVVQEVAFAFAVHEAIDGSGALVLAEYGTGLAMGRLTGRLGGLLTVADLEEGDDVANLGRGCLFEVIQHRGLARVASALRQAAASKQRNDAGPIIAPGSAHQ